MDLASLPGSQLRRNTAERDWHSSRSTCRSLPSLASITPTTTRGGGTGVAAMTSPTRGRRTKTRESRPATSDTLASSHPPEPTDDERTSAPARDGNGRRGIGDNLVGRRHRASGEARTGSPQLDRDRPSRRLAPPHAGPRVLDRRRVSLRGGGGDPEGPE